MTTQTRKKSLWRRRRAFLRAHRGAFLYGLRDGMPIALGYFAVSFSLGIAAKSAGFKWFQGALMSFLVHASAGEYAGITLVAMSASYIETAVMLFVANARYLLMSCALSQKFSPKTGLLHRIIVGFGITDEIFGITIARSGRLDPYYTYGAMTVAIPFWSLGTALGIIAGNILPFRIVSALSVALYGMFIAIIIPPARQNKVVLALVLISFALSYVCGIVPAFSALSSGTRTIILTVVISAAAAILFPTNNEEEAEEDDA